MVRLPNTETEKADDLLDEPDARQLRVDRRRGPDAHDRRRHRGPRRLNDEPPISLARTEDRARRWRANRCTPVVELSPNRAYSFRRTEALFSAEVVSSVARRTA